MVFATFAFHVFFLVLFFKGSKIKLKKLENCGVLEENEVMKRAFEFDSLFGKEEK